MENNENLPEIKQVAGIPTIDGYAENLQAKLQMCKLFRESGFAPAAFKNDGSVLAAILYGQELGFTPIQSLQSVDVIQGKPTLSAQGIKAMILAAGGVIRELEWTDKICKLEGNRAGNIIVTEYTIEEAIKAGLANKDNWKRMPKDMLYARCISRYARNHWADKLKGVYGAEEMRDAVIVPQEQGAVIVADDLPESKIARSWTTDETLISADIQDNKEIWTGQFPLGFGKHKDTNWCDVNANYLEWLFQNTKGEKAINAGLEINRRENEQQKIFDAINLEAAKSMDEFDADELPSFNNKGE